MQEETLKGGKGGMLTWEQEKPSSPQTYTHAHTHLHFRRSADAVIRGEIKCVE